MPNVSVIYRFRCDLDSPFGFTSKNDPATDAANVSKNWAVLNGRSSQTIVDDRTVFIARLTFDEARSQEAADDLNKLCAVFGLIREVVMDQETESLRLDASI